MSGVPAPEVEKMILSPTELLSLCQNAVDRKQPCLFLDSILFH